jgi:SNF2 family DNA or RNA helicase
MLERQWNPANEEQAEGRFARIGQEDNIIVTYMLASETIDEKFTEIVETKRAIIANTLDGKEYQWDQASLMKELATVLVMKGKKKWTL